MVCEEELSDPRNDDHGNGPERVPSYGHKYGALHDRVVGNQEPDETFHSHISNKLKVDYICKTLRLAPYAFHLDLPFPLEDWALSDDAGLINAGLYFSDLRRQFYEQLLREHRELENGPVFHAHGEAQFWNHEFNRVLNRKHSGVLLVDTRVLH